MARLAADTTDPLGALEPLVPRFLADVVACGSTLLAGWSPLQPPSPLLLPYPLLSLLIASPSFYLIPLAIFLSLGLRLVYRKTVFNAVDGVVISLSARLPSAISVREKVFPPKFEPTPTDKQPTAVVRPVS